MTVVQGRFEWDSEKNEINIKKHGFSFEEILSAFDDPHFIERADLEHSAIEEERFIGFGSINGLVIVATIFIERDRIRIISSRLATKKEEAFYYEQQKNFDS